MLNEIISFFKREKGYTLLFAALCVLYGTLFVIHGKTKGAEEKPKILEQFKQAEDKAQAKIKSLGSIEAYLKDRPDLAFWANLFSAVFILGVTVGIVLDWLLLTRPEFRAWFQRIRGPSGFDWKTSFLFKFFIWFFTINIGISFVLEGIQRFTDGNENFFLLLHTNCAEVVSFLVIVWMVLKHGGKLSDIGFTIPDGKWFREMRIGWGGYVAVLPVFGAVLLVLLVITKLLHYEPPPHPLVPIFLEGGDQSRGLIVYSLLLAAVVGPVFEEIFFRGFCYPVLKQRFGALASMVLTSSFFAFIHDSTFAFWPIFVLGMALNYVYEKRGSLLANITLHITHNLFFLGYFFLAKDIISREIGG